MKVLVISIPGIGNTLLTIPMIKKLKQNCNADIDVLVGIKGSAEILKGCPYINNIYYINKKVQKGLLHNILTLIKLKRRKYDVSITTFPAAQIHYGILSFLIGAKKRISHKYRNKKDLFHNIFVPIKTCHDVEQNINLIIPLLRKNYRKNVEKPKLRLWLSKKEKEFGKNFVKKFKEKLVIGIHPGTSLARGMFRKRWPIKNFSKLINKILENRKARILIFLGPEELNLANIKNMVDRKFKDKISLVKDLDIRKVAAIIEKCNVFISNDSGLMHIAVALKIPTVAIFVSTDYRRTFPYGKGIVVRASETYKLFRQSIEELKGIDTKWKKRKIKYPSVKAVFNAFNKIIKS